VQEIISRNFAAAAIKERQDIAELNKHLETDLKKRGLVFNYPDKKAFIDTLRTNGYYKEAKEKYGAESWSKLEKYTGTL